MKKRFLFSFVCCFLSLNLFANGKIRSNVEISVKTENIPESEAVWLGPAVAEKLEANLSKYTDFAFINGSNRSDIFNIQKRSESDAFDEDDSLEIGKLKNADYQLFTTIRKVKDDYIVSIKFTDVTTGVNKTTILSSPRSNVQNLYSSNGCAVDEITIGFCDALGINLSVVERNFIMKGDIGLLVEERKAIYDAEEELYIQRINELNKQIDISASDVDSSILQEQLKVEKALAEEKLKIAQENKRRVAEEVAMQKADEIKNAERTAAQKKRISSMEVELNNKMKTMRSAQFEEQSLIGKVKIIELKKNAVIDINDSIFDEIKEVFNNAVKNISEKEKEIKNRPYRAAELQADGKTPADIAVAQREKSFEKAKKNIIESGQKNVDSIINRLCEQQDVLLLEIKDDYKKLASGKISTLGNELYVTYGAYDGNKLGWNLNVTVKSDDAILFQTKSFLLFETLTGKDPIKYSEDDYFGYLDDVDFYDSLLLRGEPILVYELEYSAKPDDVNNTYEYEFNFDNLKCYDTQSLKVKKNKLYSKNVNTLPIDDRNITRSVAYSYDINSISDDFPTLVSLMEKRDIENKVEEKKERRNEVASVLNDNRGIFEKPVLMPAGTDGTAGPEGTYVLFGNWPQSIKDENIIIYKKPLKINGWTCYCGNDGFYYVKAKINPLYSFSQFSNGQTIKKDSEYYFKLEPIKWRLVTDNYMKKSLLVAENILAVGFFDQRNNNYKDSDIRQWLNNDFINMAFTKKALKKITTVKVDNSDDSIVESSFGSSGSSKYICEDTKDKIFLLSVNEVTKSDYDFNEKSSRVRQKTDFLMGEAADWYWLRSPDSYDIYEAQTIDGTGYAYKGKVNGGKGGIVPALTVSF